MNERVIGIITKQTDYRDSDVILTVYTKEYGKLSFLAASARKMTSKNAGAILPYTKAEIQFDYREQKTMFRLKTARAVSLYRSVHEDLVLSSAAAVMGELADVLTIPMDGLDISDRLFTILDQGFSLLSEKKDSVTVLALFISDLMKIYGIGADVDECVICGSQLVSAISVREGGFLCAEHARSAGLAALPAADLKRFRLIVKANMEHFGIVEKAGGAEMSDLETLVSVLRTHGGFDIKSFELYRRVLDM